LTRPATLHHWIDSLPEKGRYVFTRAEAAVVAEASDAAVKMALYRLKRSGAIVSPRRDFFVVVPREYRTAGCAPATWFIDDLMRHLGRRYYVALLSAAALHGAGHQQPMAFQVIAEAAERDIEVGRVRIEFHVSNRFEGAATESLQTETGTMRVATPETTAFDLVRFPAASGYWSNIATVLAELTEKLDPLALATGAARVARSDVQRLGWLLDLVGQPVLADALAATLSGRRLLPTPLTSTRQIAGAPLDSRWRVLVNDDVELDL
jgi:predicted transcriptional regulator of viral defense system